MDKTCTICKAEAKYKCPTCLIYYCSVHCCNKHREKGCDVLANEGKTLPQAAPQFRYTSADTVPLAKLEALRNDDSLRSVLCNPHLREVLVVVNNSEEPEKIMQKAMQEPLFVEFADACMKIVEPRDTD